MTIRILSLVICAAALAASALAASKTFNVSGQDPDGGYYTGTVTLKQLPASGVGKADAVRVTWNIGGDQVVGIALIDPFNDSMMSLGYVLEGRAGVAHMVEKNGSVSGVWSIEGSPGVGFETWTP